MTERLHCLACQNVRSLERGRRVFCACERSSARRRGDTVVLIGPARIVDDGGPAEVEVIRPTVAVAM